MPLALLFDVFFAAFFVEDFVEDFFEDFVVAIISPLGVMRLRNDWRPKYTRIVYRLEYPFRLNKRASKYDKTGGGRVSRRRSCSS